MKKNIKNKKLLKLATIFLLAIGLVMGYVAVIVLKAYFDSPKIVSSFYSSNKAVLKIEQLPENFRELLLKVEDPNFYNHTGIDLETPGAGYTTITQSLVKKYFFPEGFSPGFLRQKKVKQSLIAIVFNSKVDKNTQLDMFINTVYLGNNEGKEVIGFQEGAKIYFNKDFSTLTFDEYMSLVAMIIAPNDFQVIKQPTKNKERVKRITKLLNGECTPQNLTDVYYETCK